MRIRNIGKIDDDYEFEYCTLPEKAVLIKEEGLMKKGLEAGIFGILVGFTSLILKNYFINEGNFSIDRKFILIGCILGIGIIFIHEILHLIPYPTDSEKLIGIDGKIPFSFCPAAVSKLRFIVSSLLPVMLGILPLLAFIFLPNDFVRINAVLWAIGTIGLGIAGPDYVETYIILRTVPKNAWIQSGKEGFYYYYMEKC